MMNGKNRKEVLNRDLRQQKITKEVLIEQTDTTLLFKKGIKIIVSLLEIILKKQKVLKIFM